MEHRERQGGRERGPCGDPATKNPFFLCPASAFPRSSQIFLDYRNTNNILKLDGKSLRRGGYLFKGREVK